MTLKTGICILTPDEINKSNLDNYKHYLSVDESLEFSNTQNKLNYLVKRMVAKNALFNALALQPDPIVCMNLRIANDEMGRPFFLKNNYIKSFLKKYGITKSHLSLSDELGHVLAWVVLE